MKICIVNTYFPPWRGGAESYVLNLARELASVGHSVEVICASHAGRPSTEVGAQLTVRRLKPIALLYGVPILPGLFLELLRVKADIVHVNFPNPFNALICGLVARAREIPTLLTWHNDLPPVTPASSVLVKIHDKLLSPLYRSLYKVVVATSREYASSSYVLTRCRDRVRIVPNGVDCSRFHPRLNGSNVRKKWNLDDGAKVLLFVGALTKWHTYKGLPVLFQALQLSRSKLRDVFLLVVGQGDRRPYYEALARRAGLGDRVVFAGNVSDEDLPYYYAASDALVLPSLDRSEGFGVVLLEANACGKPVLASRVGGIPSYVKERSNGLLVEPQDPHSLAEGIVAILAGRLDAEICRSAAEAYDWKEVVNRITAIYASLS